VYEEENTSDFRLPPRSRVNKSKKFLTPDDVSDKLYRNVGKELPLYATYYSENQSPQKNMISFSLTL